MLTNNIANGQFCLRERHEVRKNANANTQKIYAGRLFKAETSFIYCCCS